MMKIWVNDELKFSFNGHTNYTPNYIRIGIDKWDWRLNWHTSSTPSREIYFDEFRIGDSLATYMDVRPGLGLPLPILWTFFEAHKNNTCVDLYWEAEFGTNFIKFIVERNTGTGWESIGQVENNIQHRFGFVDCHPKLNNLYRIRAINTGEADSYSSVKSIRFPVQGPQKIAVFNEIGQLIKYQTVNGSTIFQIKTELNLRSGLYIIRYENGDSEKFFIQ